MPDVPPPGPRWSKTVLIVAVVLAVAAVVLVQWYVSRIERRQKEGELMLVEATRRLETNHTLLEADVAMRPVPAMDPGAAQKFVKQDQLPSLIDGRRPLLRPVEKGEYLRWSHFTPDAAEPVQEVVPPGQRGLAIRVARNNALGPLLRPGVYVDLLATVPPNASRGVPAMTVTVLERVLVLAVGGRTLLDPADERAGSQGQITIQVTPQQAEQLAAIDQFLRDGWVLTLRNSRDPAGAGKDRLGEALRNLGLSAAESTAPPP